MSQHIPEDAADARHETPLKSAKEPPSQPAKPPMGEEVWAQRETQRAQDVRAQALRLSAALYSVPRSEVLILPANVFDLADEIAAYITDGTKPS